MLNALEALERNLYESASTEVTLFPLCFPLDKSKYEPRHGKMLMPYANNKGADQPAHPHPRSLISAFVVHCIASIIPLFSIFEISSLYLASMADQASLSQSLSQTRIQVSW